MTTLAEQIATLESRLAAHESRKVPLSADILWRIFNDHDGGPDTSILAVARAALVAAESEVAVESALGTYSANDHGFGSRTKAMLAAIRAAHDAAIDGECGTAREDAGPPWLADAAEALGQKGAALNWSQVISEIRELVRQRDAFSGEADRYRRECERLADRIETLNREGDALEKERDNLRRQFDALTRPIDGVEELGRIGWEAWQLAIDCPPRPHATERNVTADNANAQAIASRVIGALRGAMARGYRQSYLVAFDNAVASLKIEPAKVETTPVDTRPVVKVGQVWQYNGNDIVSVADIRDWTAFDASNKTAFGIADDGRPMARGWRLVSDTPTPKREPFELPSQKASESLSCRSWTETLDADKNAIRDRIREIERRLEAGGL